MAANNNYQNLPIQEDILQAMWELVAHESRAAELRRMLGEWATRQEASRRVLPFNPPPQHNPTAEVLRRQRDWEGWHRLGAEGNEALQSLAHRVGVNYISLRTFVLSEELHTFASEFTEDAFFCGGVGCAVARPGVGPALSHRVPWTLTSWCELFRTEQRLLWLQEQVSSGTYAFDPAQWFSDEPGLDKRHFTMADHITRFVLLAENFRHISGRPEWANDRFGRPEARLDMYKHILLLFIENTEKKAVEIAAANSM